MFLLSIYLFLKLSIFVISNKKWFLCSFITTSFVLP